MRRRNRKSPLTGRVSRSMLFWGAAGAVSLYLLFFFVFGRMGLIAQMRLKMEASRVEGEIEKARVDVARLTDETRQLEAGGVAVEHLARERLGLGRPGETVYLFENGKAAPPEAVKVPGAP